MALLILMGLGAAAGMLVGLCGCRWGWWVSAKARRFAFGACSTSSPLVADIAGQAR